jgi:hypothetical protein
MDENQGCLTFIQVPLKVLPHSRKNRHGLKRVSLNLLFPAIISMDFTVPKRKRPVNKAPFFMVHGTIPAEETASYH